MVFSQTKDENEKSKKKGRQWNTDSLLEICCFVRIRSKSLVSFSVNHLILSCCGLIRCENFHCRARIKTECFVDRSAHRDCEPRDATDTDDARGTTRDTHTHSKVPAMLLNPIKKLTILIVILLKRPSTERQNDIDRIEINTNINAELTNKWWQYILSPLSFLSSRFCSCVACSVMCVRRFVFCRFLFVLSSSFSSAMLCDSKLACYWRQFVSHFYHDDRKRDISAIV